MPCVQYLNNKKNCERMNKITNGLKPPPAKYWTPPSPCCPWPTKAYFSTCWRNPTWFADNSTYICLWLSSAWGCATVFQYRGPDNSILFIPEPLLKRWIEPRLWGTALWMLWRAPTWCHCVGLFVSPRQHIFLGASFTHFIYLVISCAWQLAVWPRRTMTLQQCQRVRI